MAQTHCILNIIGVVYLLSFLESTPTSLLFLRLWTTAFSWSKQRPGLRYSALLSQNNSQQTFGRGGLQSLPVWRIVLSIYFTATVDVFRDAAAFDLYQYHTDRPLLFFCFSLSSSIMSSPYLKKSLLFIRVSCWWYMKAVSGSGVLVATPCCSPDGCGALPRQQRSRQPASTAGEETKGGGRIIILIVLRH